MMTTRQREVFNYIAAVAANEGIAPTYREIGKALGLQSMSSVKRIVEGLEERGFIRRLPRRARAIEIIRKDAIHVGKH